MDTDQHAGKIRRRNIEGDRLSSLPNDVIHKILSFVSTKQAIQASTLSSSWRFIWTSLPYLTFSRKDFDTLPKFNSFVTHVLSRRDNQIEVSSIKLSGFHGDITEELVKKVRDYAFSHNVQQLTITSFNDKRRVLEVPLSPSLTLKHLTLRSFIACTSTWEFPALTTLYLSHITLYGDNVRLFSKCANLKNLTLHHLTMSRSSGGSEIVDFCHSGLSNLRLENVCFNIDVMNLIAVQLKNLSLVRKDKSTSAVLNVVAPQLKNLTVRDWLMLISLNLLSAPELGSYLCSLDKVDLSSYKPLSVFIPYKTEARKITSLLQQLRNARHLTLSWDIIRLLSSSMELIPHLASPFVNLKSLKVYPRPKALSYVEETMPACFVKYFLGGSPGATVTMVTSKEMRALENAASAQKLMAELQVQLEQEKKYTKTNRAYLGDLVKAPMESEPNMHEQGNAEVDKIQHDDDHNGGRMLEIISCWEDLSVQIEEGKKKTRDIISKLQDIKGLLRNLPASKKPKIQASYSSLHAEAHTVINNIRINRKQKCSNIIAFESFCKRARI